MRDVRLISPRLGEFTFDGAQAILSSFSCSYPRLTRKAIAKNAALGVELLPAAVGEGRIRIEGYLIPSEGALFDKKRLLCAIASVGGEFALTVDGLRRTVETERLEFLPEGAFGRGRGDHFVLTLISASPFFEGDEVTFYGRYTVADALYFPHAISAAGDSVGTISSRGSVTVSNCGDAPCGFVARFHFPAAATSFILKSDAYSDNFAVTRSIDAGETLTLDTRYGKKSVVNASGESELGNLDKRCAFFILPPGENELTWYCSSSSPPDVSVRIVPQYIFA